MPIIKTDKPLRKRDAFDFYPTPLALCIAALAQLPEPARTPTILDPGAGTGVWGIAAAKRFSQASIDGVEIRIDAPRPSVYTGWHHEDFRLYDPGWKYDLIIGNPPYKYAEAFIRHSLSMLKDYGWLVFLLRLAFLEEQDRGKDFWRKVPPERVSVCSQRPSFTGDGNTDATAYAVYYWRKGWTGPTRLDWLRW